MHKKGILYAFGAYFIWGIMHYITPTCQFLIGVLIYKEAFDVTKAIGFGIVWTGLIVFAAEGYRTYRAIPVKSAPEMGEG